MSRPEVEESLRALRVSAFTCSLVSSRAEMRGARRREGSAVSPFPLTLRPRNKPYIFSGSPSSLYQEAHKLPFQ